MDSHLEGSVNQRPLDPEPQSPDSFDPLLDSQSRQSPIQKDPSLKKVLTSLRQVARRPSSEHINKLVSAGIIHMPRSFKVFCSADRSGTAKKILLNAGLLSYLLFTFRLLWKLSMRFRSQPRSVGVSFVVPSVAMYAFVQHHTVKEVNETDMGILQAAVDVTILAGTFICTFVVWYIISLIGDLGAAVFIAVTLGIWYFSVDV
ncbi:hypothetical protein C8R41DRAFT_919931 [Lentinula lateritia]|uniref:Chitin synthase export chaperone n=1 Tax=Lentinula lateritia TaxID=40482 RepID=A0ABQ8VFG0_9AGAR|nr:hypothetical protein C8R41DRAFT_919931 [Lentinula lateritia]